MRVNDAAASEGGQMYGRNVDYSHHFDGNGILHKRFAINVMRIRFIETGNFT